MKAFELLIKLKIFQNSHCSLAVVAFRHHVKLATRFRWAWEPMKCSMVHIHAIMPIKLKRFQKVRCSLAVVVFFRHHGKIDTGLRWTWEPRTVALHVSKVVHIKAELPRRPHSSSSPAFSSQCSSSNNVIPVKPSFYASHRRLPERPGVLLDLHRLAAHQPSLPLDG